MELKSISGQQGQTLFEFYDSKEWPSQWGRMPEMMCQLIKTLDLFDHEPVWVFTSHAVLIFTDKDDYKDWQVLAEIIKIDEKQIYKIVVAQKDPWNHLIGYADNHFKAAELIICGLSVSPTGINRNVFLESN